MSCFPVWCSWVFNSKKAWKSQHKFPLIINENPKSSGTSGPFVGFMTCGFPGQGETWWTPQISQELRSCSLPGLVKIQKANWKPWPSRNSGYFPMKIAWWIFPLQTVSSPEGTQKKKKQLPKTPNVSRTLVLRHLHILSEPNRYLTGTSGSLTITIPWEIKYVQVWKSWLFIADLSSSDFTTRLKLMRTFTSYQP